MANNTIDSLGRKIGIFGSALAVIAAVTFTGTASATTVTVDGIKTAGEYTGADSGSISLLWYNEHNSIYTKAAGNMNPLVWEINEIAPLNFSLNIFFEVPTYARRMLWSDGCSYNGGAVSAACAPLAPGGDTSYLDAYDAGSHHASGVNMDYDTQTKSEFFELDGVIGGFKQKWQDEDGDGIADDHTWDTSREYLIANSPNCSLTECTEFDKTSSIEVMWQGYGSAIEAALVRDSIESMQLHLSDEAVGLPAVPVPAAFWLFGTALIGFIGISRRTNLG